MTELPDDFTEQQLRDYCTEWGHLIYVMSPGGPVEFCRADADRQEYYLGLWMGSRHKPVCTTDTKLLDAVDRAVAAVKASKPGDYVVVKIPGVGKHHVGRTHENN